MPEVFEGIASVAGDDEPVETFGQVRVVVKEFALVASGRVRLGLDPKDFHTGSCVAALQVRIRTHFRFFLK